MNLVNSTVLSLFCLANALSAAGKLHRDLEKSADSKEPVAVIVRYSGKLTDGQVTRAQNLGAKLLHRLPATRSAAYRVSGAKLKELEKDPEIELIVPDRGVSAQGATGANEVLVRGE